MQHQPQSSPAGGWAAARRSRRRREQLSWLAAVAAAALAESPLGADAATGTIQDVQHVVILTLENRSFDHYFGSLKGVRGFGDHGVVVQPNGNSLFYQAGGPGYVLPFPLTNQCLPDVEHTWSAGHAVWNGGKWNQWIGVVGPGAMPYFRRTELPFYYALADGYTVCDAYHCSVLGPTSPNRLYLMSGMIDPGGAAGGPVTATGVPANTLTWTTYPERLQAAGISWRVYQGSWDFYPLNPLSSFANFKNAAPGNPLYDRGLALVSDLVDAFRFDVTNGTLPQVSWLIPRWQLCEHPPYTPANGQVLVSQLLQALAANPAVRNSTIFMINYDEAGGFFDHVPPPTPPPGTPGEFINGQPIGLGTRVPMILISPWSRGGRVCSQLFDHTSVLRFLEAWTGVAEPNIGAWRRQVCGDLTSAFDFANPNTNYPALPPTDYVWCSSPLPAPAVPTPQIAPPQEPGFRPSLPVPYRLDAFAVEDCAASSVAIILTNAGSASAHFMIYANAYRGDGPWQYDVPAQGSVVARFQVLTNGGLYDLSCYGPDGFHRRLAGNLSSHCNQWQATARFDASAGGLTLAFRNAGSAAATFSVTDGIGTAGPWTYLVAPGATVTDPSFAGGTSGGWYDFSVTVNSDSSFLRRFVGHVSSLALPAPPAPGVTQLLISVTGTNLLLTYPGLLATNVLESSPSLATPAWTPVGIAPTVTGSNCTVTLPLSPGAAYFRVRP